MIMWPGLFSNICVDDKEVWITKIIKFHSIWILNTASSNVDCCLSPQIHMVQQEFGLKKFWPKTEHHGEYFSPLRDFVRRKPFEIFTPCETLFYNTICDFTTCVGGGVWIITKFLLCRNIFCVMYYKVYKGVKSALCYNV